MTLTLANLRWLGLRGPVGCKRDGLRCTDGGDSCWRRSDGRACCDCGRTAAGVRSHVRVDAVRGWKRPSSGCSFVELRTLVDM
jgi:hypothetical protein